MTSKRTDFFIKNQNHNKEKIIEFLADTRERGYCDDCLSNKLQIEPRQQVNQICHRLKTEGKIKRIKSDCQICKKQKILNFLNEDWFFENVCFVAEEETLKELINYLDIDEKGGHKLGEYKLT